MDRVESYPDTAAFGSWLERLLEKGESVQTEAPPQALPAGTREILQRYYELQALDVAGTPLHFHAETAMRAIHSLAYHCWAVASGIDDSTGFVWHSEPVLAADHLCADLALKYMPVVYRRAQARAAASELVREQQSLLRAWPLSGVLADIDEEPTTALDFDNHPGLMLLYAERLVQKPRAGWVPTGGLAREWVERVFQERGKPLPKQTPKEAGGE
ncbi:hypothetical protein BH11PLA2_BH11PLA2_37490 [soil metagenome]